MTKIRQEQISGGNDGWIASQETWTYASATTFTISGDKTGKYQKGDKVKLTQTTVKYFYIIGVSYSSPNTTITITGGSDYSLASATITSPYYSKIENPHGFPTSFNYTATVTAPGGTAPTFASIVTKFSIAKGIISAWGNLTNASGGTAGAGAVTLYVLLPVAESLGVSMIGNGVCYSAGVTLLGVFCRASSTTFYMHDVAMANVNAAAFSNAARQLHFAISYPLA